MSADADQPQPGQPGGEQPAPAPPQPAASATPDPASASPKDKDEDTKEVLRRRATDASGNDAPKSPKKPGATAIRVRAMLPDTISKLDREDIARQQGAATVTPHDTAALTAAVAAEKAKALAKAQAAQAGKPAGGAPGAPASPSAAKPAQSASGHQLGGSQDTKILTGARLELWRYTPAYRKALWRAALIAPALVFLLAAVYVMAGDERNLQNGELSFAHAGLESNCEACHSPFGKASEQHCRACHDVGAHVHERPGQAAVSATGNGASCTACHMEHRGRNVHLTMPDSRLCTSCHDHDGHEFTGAHPEFAAVKNNVRSTGLKMSHAVHMDPLLPGGALECASCHEVSRAGDMLPVRHELHCMGCHELPLQHADELGFAAKKAERAIWADVAALSKGELNKIAQGKADAPAPVAALFAADKIELAEGMNDDLKKYLVDRRRDALFGLKDGLLRNLDAAVESCALCHDFLPDGKVVPLAPQDVMGKARFDHLAHRASGSAALGEGSASCKTCHAGVVDAQDLRHTHMPGIKSCQTCHNPTGATTRCASCHDYHAHARVLPAPKDWLPKPREKVEGK